MSTYLRDLTQNLNETIHLGMLVPWANQAMEAELPVLFPRRVIWHVARLVPPNATTALDDEFLTGMIRSVPQAVFQLRNLPLRALAFGCTSASSAFPDEVTTVLKTLQTGQRSIPFLTAFSALCLLLTACHAERIVLITPYEHELTLREAHAFEYQGITVQAAISLGYRDEIGTISTQQLLEACASSSLAGAEALVLSCTALHTLEVIPLLEERYRLPVLSSNTALALASILVATNLLPLSQENKL
jgi:maleate isomerase